MLCLELCLFFVILIQQTVQPDIDKFQNFIILVYTLITTTIYIVLIFISIIISTLIQLIYSKFIEKFFFQSTYATYYVFMLCENTFLMSMWYIKCDPSKWYRIPAMAGHFLSFFTGLIFMVIDVKHFFLYYKFASILQTVYYLLVHPTGDIKLWITEVDERDDRDRHKHARRGGHKRPIQNGLWTTQGKVLHPRTASPNSSHSSYSDIRINRRNSKGRRSQSQETQHLQQHQQLQSQEIIVPKGTCV